MYEKQTLSAIEAAGMQWDCVIAGAGMGGAAAAFVLAGHGFRVLIVEKGKARFQTSDSVTRETPDPVARLNSGRWPTQISGMQDGQALELWAPLGSGLGGSTTLYAAALHRLRPEDFAPQLHPAGGTVAWPFSYEDIRPYYARAETLFAVRGTADPLRDEPDFALPPPPQMCERDGFLFRAFEQAGLHPFQLHSGISYIEGCQECLGSFCPSGCKRDARNSLLDPALKTGNLFLCCEAEADCVLSEETAGVSEARGLSVRQSDISHKISAGTVILAAGAYFTPAILLRSVSPAWPTGLANRNDLVGRNLMFHVSEPIAVWSRRKLSKTGPTKTTALRDFYIHEGEKYGELQSAGMSANYANILYSLRLIFDQSRFRRLPLIRQILRIPAWLVARILGEAVVFTTIVEDFPYPENRILADPGTPSGIRFEYRLHEELRRRSDQLKRLFRARLKSVWSLPLSHRARLNYGHPCGTCKAGNDPASSVLDVNCKAHGVESLYVLDSSFMPTSGGTNPSLTIAANSMRVAEIIAQDRSGAAGADVDGK